jgi:hypothetical protein
LYIPPSPDRHDSSVSEKSHQRKKSLSLDDLELIKDSYDQDGPISEHAKDIPLEIHEVYAQPKTPVQEPPYRPDTPPGMPSWTEHQLRPLQLRLGRRTSFGFRQFFSIRSSRAGLTSQGQDLPSGRRSASAPVAPGAPRIARFRPPRSTYGPIDQHPFNRAPTAVIDPFLQPISPRATAKRKIVRFTPSTAAHDTEVVALEAGIEQDCSHSPHSLGQIGSTPLQSTPTRPAIARRQRVCPHLKGHTAYKWLKHSNPTLTEINYQAILSHPLTRERSHASLPRPSLPSPTRLVPDGWSVCGEGNWDMGIIDTEPISGACSTSSTTHLMSGALTALSPSPAPVSSYPDSHTFPQPLAKNNRCWRCKFASLREKFAKMRRRGASCLWFVCCGFDTDEDSSTYPPRTTTMEMGGRVSEPRRRDQVRDGWWSVAESPLGPARRIVFDNTQPWIV